MMTNTQNTIVTTFCDKSTTIATFLDTSFGNVSARDEFRKMVDMARDNGKVWGPNPHIVKVELSPPTGISATEEFRCPCRGLSGAVG